MTTPTFVGVMAKPHKAPKVRRHKGLNARRYKAVADCAAKTLFISAKLKIFAHNSTTLKNNF